MNTISTFFLSELFKSCLYKQDILDICIKHLEFHYLPSDPYKKLWKAIRNYYIAEDTIPSIGIISQSFRTNTDIIDIIADIKNADLPPKDRILKELDLFIKQSLFVEAYDKLAEFYNAGEHEKAFNYMKNRSEEIHNFSAYQSSYFQPIFGKFSERSRKRELDAYLPKKHNKIVYTGIHEFDHLTNGLKPGNTACFVGASGAGKSKILKHIGVSNAKRGLKVLHIQGEGTEQECLDAYDATWTGSIPHDIDTSNFDDKKKKAIEKSIKQFQSSGAEIYVHSYEQFKSADVAQLRQLILDGEKIHGHFDLVLIDYLELFDPGDGRKYGVSEERHRRLAIAERIKNVAVELKNVIITATQANDVTSKDRNEPTFVMTRSNISECKGLSRPFTLFATLNQTDAEYKNNKMRIYIDKARFVQGKHTISIYQAYKYERFYDGKKTLNELYRPNIIEKEYNEKQTMLKQSSVKKN